MLVVKRVKTLNLEKTQQTQGSLLFIIYGYIFLYWGTFFLEIYIYIHILKHIYYMVNTVFQVPVSEQISFLIRLNENKIELCLPDLGCNT